MDTEPLCPNCHQPILPEYYFCPNCGNKLKQPPLSTSLVEQLKVYAHSAVLPMLAFITISKWKGVQYLKSDDPKARQIGTIACGLLVISTILTVWYTIALARSFSQSITDSMNASLGGY